MSRIGKAYEARFRALLSSLHARQLEKGVQSLVAQARQNAIDSRRLLPRVLSDRYEHLRSQVRRWQCRFPSPAAAPEPRHFLCDGGLGGLARWLRAAGYQAAWAAGVDDADLVQRADLLGATLLTTDSLMMDRGVLRDGRIPALWLPPPPPGRKLKARRHGSQRPVLQNLTFPGGSRITEAVHATAPAPAFEPNRR